MSDDLLWTVTIEPEHEEIDTDPTDDDIADAKRSLGPDATYDDVITSAVHYAAMRVETEESDPAREVIGWHLVCPHCQAHDTIKERDKAIRWNDLSDLEQVKPGQFVVSADTSNDADFENDGWFCSTCDKDVEMPDNLKVDY